MSEQHFTIFYVNDVVASTAFYERLLGRAPIDASPGFAMFGLSEGAMLGLWRRGDVQPAPRAAAGAAELALVATDNSAVDQRHAQWRAAGIEIVQAPTAMDFGYTFTGIDPDGHRVRVFAPAAP